MRQTKCDACDVVIEGMEQDPRAVAVQVAPAKGDSPETIVEYRFTIVAQAVRRNQGVSKPDLCHACVDRLVNLAFEETAAADEKAAAKEAPEA